MPLNIERNKITKPSASKVSTRSPSGRVRNPHEVISSRIYSQKFRGTDNNRTSKPSSKLTSDILDRAKNFLYELSTQQTVVPPKSTPPPTPTATVGGFKTQFNRVPHPDAPLKDHLKYGWKSGNIQRKFGGLARGAGGVLMGVGSGVAMTMAQNAVLSRLNKEKEDPNQHQSREDQAQRQRERQPHDSYRPHPHQYEELIEWANNFLEE